MILSSGAVTVLSVLSLITKFYDHRHNQLKVAVFTNEFNRDKRTPIRKCKELL